MFLHLFHHGIVKVVYVRSWLTHKIKISSFLQVSNYLLKLLILSIRKTAFEKLFGFSQGSQVLRCTPNENISIHNPDNPTTFGIVRLGLPLLEEDCCRTSEDAVFGPELLGLLSRAPIPASLS